MDDVFMGNEKENSNFNKAKPHTKKRRRLKQYILDLVVKSLIVAFLLAIDFSLFAQAGSYSIFDMHQTLYHETYWIYIAIIAVSSALMFLCSFSQTLQNFLIGIATSFLLLSLFNQFALFDAGAMLLSYFPLTEGLLTEIISMYSHLIVAAILALLVTIVFTYTKRKTQFYILLLLVLVCLTVMSKQYFNPVVRNFIEKPFLNDESKHKNGNNIVYIGLTNAATYNNLKAFDPKGIRSDIKQSANNMLGFYQKNNFTYYPNSYLKYTHQPYLNLVSILNSDNNVSSEELLLSDIISFGYWDFSTLRKEKLYLKNNSLFDKYHQKDYNLRIYQKDGIELCTINNNFAVNRCIEQINYPIDLNYTQLSLGEKISLLAAQWLESTGIIPTVDPILGIISAFNRDIAPLHFSALKLGSFNAFASLDRIAEDIMTDNGNNIYFTVIDIPGELFIYDSLCSIKPLNRWIDSTDKTINQLDKYVAYAEQNSCLYGQLENFVQKLESNGKLKQTSIIIQGLNTAFATTPGIEKDVLKSLQRTKQGGTAIYTPNIPQANIDNRLCLSPSIVNNFVNSQNNCTELEDLALTDKLRKDILKQNQQQKISTKDAETALKSFKNWYHGWAAQNQVSNAMEEEIIPLEKNVPSEDIKEIKEINVAEVAVELPPEVETEPLTKTPAEVKESLQDASEPPVVDTKVNSEINQNLDKPERLKKEFMEQQKKQNEQPQTSKGQPAVNVEVKIIDNSESNDVIPPAILGEIKYKPTEKTSQE